MNEVIGGMKMEECLSLNTVSVFTSTKTPAPEGPRLANADSLHKPRALLKIARRHSPVGLRLETAGPATAGLFGKGRYNPKPYHDCSL